MNIIVVCCGGVSTSILAETMKSCCKGNDVIRAISYRFLASFLDSADIVFVAPQISGLYETIKHQCEEKDVTCELLSNDVFGRMDGKTVINLASEIMGNRKTKGVKKPMKHLKITLACCGGVSTSILCNRIISECEALGYEAECKAYGASGLTNEQVKDSNVILIGPQVCFLADEVAKKFPDIPVRLMNMSDYGTMNAKNIVSGLLKEFDW